MSLSFSFVIISAQEGLEWFKPIRDSIKSEVPEINHEIIIVGEKSTTIYRSNRPHVVSIRKDFTAKPGQICFKKQFGVELASNEFVVLCHDYIALCPGWYEGYLNLNKKFDLCMNRIENLNGQRFRDWVAWDDPRSAPGRTWIMDEPWGRRITVGEPCLVPYEYSNTYWYISGAYWVARRQFMLDNPLPLDTLHSQGEDVRYSLQVRDKAVYKMNPYSTVRLLKQQQMTFREIPLKD
jgi:hypothetical protein